MNPGIRGRFQRLTWSDRLLLLLAVFWSILGIPINYSRVHGLTGLAWQCSALGVTVLWVVIAGVIAYTVIRKQRVPSDYGFSYGKGGLASLAAVAVIYVYLLIRGNITLSAVESSPPIVLVAFLEELVFRVILIDRLILLMDGIGSKAHWAILASTTLWSLPHMPSKSPAQLLGGIFLGGLFFGYVYYKSRSLLLPAWIHVVANTGQLGGMLIVGIYCLVTFADWGFSHRRQRPPARDHC